MTEPKVRIRLSRHVRADGGITDHLSVGDREVAYNAVGVEDDPRLVWWVDLETEAASGTPPRRAFLQRRGELQTRLEELAESVEVGIDPDGWPATVRAADDGFEVLVRVSSVRRFGGGELAAELRGLGDQLESIIGGLVSEPVAA